jgi:hypothetical protein
MQKKQKQKQGTERLHGAAHDLAIRTSMGLGLALVGCGGSTTGHSDASVVYAIMPPSWDSGVKQDVKAPDAVVNVPDAAVDAHDAMPVYAIMPPNRDSAVDIGGQTLDGGQILDGGSNNPETHIIYAILPPNFGRG